MQGGTKVQGQVHSLLASTSRIDIWILWKGQQIGGTTGNG